MPDLVSRVIVQVMLAKATSTSPDCTAGRRCAGARLTNLTLLASANTAAATARQESASIPRITPWLSGSEKLAELPMTPQFSTPRALTAASVGEVVAAGAWAQALPAHAASSVSAKARVDCGRMGSPLSAGLDDLRQCRQQLVDFGVGVVEVRRHADAFATGGDTDVAIGQLLAHAFAV